jgi:hypothetical protein
MSSGRQTLLLLLLMMMTMTMTMMMRAQALPDGEDRAECHPPL